MFVDFPPLISCIGPNKITHLNIAGNVFVDYEGISAYNFRVS